MMESGTRNQQRFVEILLRWYEAERRMLPWRENPAPYHVWISEIMLQQTRVEAVKGYYHRFMEQIPDIASLAEIGEEELNKLWEGLGYYSRARNLKKTAQLLVEEYGGELPSTYDELRKLPGIGPYTAGAVASIAFGQDEPAVDGNVLRVMARVTGNDGDISLPKVRMEIEQNVRAILPPGRASAFNQALMELGALICIPNGAPKCTDCPVSVLCYAKKENKQMFLPVKAKKKERRVELRTILVFQNSDGGFLIQKRPKSGLLAGMWEFPSLRRHLSASELEDELKRKGIVFHSIEPMGEAKHIFTHIEWHMRGYLIRLMGSSPRWIPDGNTGMDTGDDVGERVSAGDMSQNEGACSFGIRAPYVWCDQAALKREYSIPTAFQKYLLRIP